MVKDSRLAINAGDGLWHFSGCSLSPFASLLFQIAPFRVWFGMWRGCLRGCNLTSLAMKSLFSVVKKRKRMKKKRGCWSWLRIFGSTCRGVDNKIERLEKFFVWGFVLLISQCQVTSRRWWTSWKKNDGGCDSWSYTLSPNSRIFLCPQYAWVSSRRVVSLNGDEGIFSVQLILNDTSGRFWSAWHDISPIQEIIAESCFSFALGGYK